MVLLTDLQPEMFVKEMRLKVVDKLLTLSGNGENDCSFKVHQILVGDATGTAYLLVKNGQLLVFYKLHY